MDELRLILEHIEPHIDLNEDEKEFFTSLWKVKKAKRKQLIEQPGFVSKNRTYVVEGELRGYIIGLDGLEHTLSLAIEDWWIGAPGSFFYQEPATIYVEALEDSV